MDNGKLKIIQEWPRPQNLYELRSFIGLCSYYRRFIQWFATLARPVHETKKKVKFQWTLKKDNTFKEMKEKLLTKPLLIIHDLKKPFEVQCDACGESLGAVLLQEGHPIAYESRWLESQEQVLAIYGKELLAIILAMSSWKHYLLGTPFLLHTDHQSLKYFMTQTKLSEKKMNGKFSYPNFIFI